MDRVTGHILTEQQLGVLRKRVDDRAQWRDEADLERRRAVARELQEQIRKAGLLDGKMLTAEVLCRLVNCQCRIQNLNPLQLQKFLGAHAYRVHFAGFSGTRDDLLDLRERQTGVRDMYDGAPLEAASNALRAIASSSREEQIRGAEALLELAGAGPALVSGFLHLSHPDAYGIVNSASKAPFQKEGLLALTPEQRDATIGGATRLHSGLTPPDSPVMTQLLKWQVLLAEIREACEFADFHALDQLLWSLTPTGGIRDRQATIGRILGAASEANAEIRRDAEAKARRLIEDDLGKLTRAQLSELLTLLSTCEGKRGVSYTRFGSGFVGKNAQALLDSIEELNRWIEKLMRAPEADLPEILDQFWAAEIPGGDRLLPTTLLYLRNKESFSPWTRNLDAALYKVYAGLPSRMRSAADYLDYCRGVEDLRRQHKFAPELKDWVLWQLAGEKSPRPPTLTGGAGQFLGFSTDTFACIKELGANNHVSWFEANRERFKEAVREPVRALVSDLGGDVTQLDPALETSPTEGKTLSKIRKNIHGPKAEDCYHEHYWAAFYRKGRKKQEDCQLFLCVDAKGYEHGLYFGVEADDVKEALANGLEEDPQGANILLESLRRAGLGFRDARQGKDIDVKSPDDLSRLAREARPYIYRACSPEEAVAGGAALKNRVASDFRVLYPLFKLATEGRLDRKLVDTGPDGPEPPSDEPSSLDDLVRETHFDEEFFERLDHLIADKSQLIFEGPPGTSKTHVALAYARYLAGAGGDVQVVQFHPSYAYEDFIEGLRPATEGGSLTYRVEDGIFKRLCDAARPRPESRFVLVIDEINRGNIARIFGELLLILERREQSVLLPYSKRAFSVPRNVIILGTMNTADRSIALFDFALRRRFHFVQLTPRPEVLLAWLTTHGKPVWIRDLLDRLNAMLQEHGVESERHIGHAHFMSRHLDEEYLELLWEGTIEPLLREYFFAEPERLRAFDLEKLRTECIEAIEDEEMAPHSPSGPTAGAGPQPEAGAP